MWEHVKIWLSGELACLTLFSLLLLTGNISFFFFFLSMLFEAWWGFNFIFHVANFQSLVKIKVMSYYYLLVGQKTNDYILRPMGILPIFSILSTAQRYSICINNDIGLSDRKRFEWPRQNFLRSTISCDMTFSILVQSIRFCPHRTAEDMETWALGFIKSKVVTKGRSRADRLSSCL